jgi:hypothetical protein
MSHGSHALEEAYRSAMDRIEGQLPEDRALAQKVILWIVYAQRQLRLSELRHALAVSPGQKKVDEDNIPDVEDLVSVCAGLVIVAEGSDAIRLVHYTTHEYFERIGHDWCPSARQGLASACLGYLCLDTFRLNPGQHMTSLSGRLSEYPFLGYAALFWGFHCIKVQREVEQAALTLLLDPDLVRSALQVLLLWRYRDEPYRDIGWTGLHLTCLLGLHHLSQRLLALPQGIYALDLPISSAHTPLVLAIKAGHLSLVGLLLEHGADANGLSQKLTPLSHAAMTGRADIVQLLLRRPEVDINLMETNSFRYHLTALHHAVLRGHKAVVKLLLKDKRIEVNKTSMTWQGKPHHTALGFAARKGDPDMIEELLGHHDIIW